MGNVMRGILSGVGGAAGKYQEIQDEQRKFQLKQKNDAIEDKRKENMLKLQQQYKPSGMVDESGAEMTKGEYALAGPEGAKPAYEATAEFAQGLKTEAQAEKDKKTYSRQWVTKEGDPMTEWEVAEAQKEPNWRDNLKSVSEVKLEEEGRKEESRIAAEDRKDLKKTKREETKADKAYKADFLKGVRKTVSEIASPKPSDRWKTILKEADIQGDERLEDLPEVKTARNYEATARKVKKMYDEKASPELVEGELTKQGYDKEEIGIMLDLVGISKGWFGWKGFGK